MNIIYVVQIIIAIALVLAILLQVRSQDIGLFGASTSVFRARRGFEKIVFQTTIILSIIFVILAIAGARLSQINA
ncbi:MAG: preprotein translocase subunit SecG [Dehalococcoidia bacterium]